MAMISLKKCEQIAAGKPDVSSAMFRNAVGSIAAFESRTSDNDRLYKIRSIKASLLAHGEPQPKPKLSKERLSEIRRDASSKALVARSKAALGRKLANNRRGITTVSDRKPAIFDAALEMIEDRTVVCIGTGVETIHFKDTQADHRNVTIAALDANRPTWAIERECPWSSRRQQAEEGRI